jgi:hypothetical protein
MTPNNLEAIADSDLRSGLGPLVIAPDVSSGYGSQRQGTRLEKSRKHEPLIEPQARNRSFVRIRFQ